LFGLLPPVLRSCTGTTTEVVEEPVVPLIHHPRVAREAGDQAEKVGEIFGREKVSEKT